MLRLKKKKEEAQKASEAAAKAEAENAAANAMDTETTTATSASTNGSASSEPAKVSLLGGIGGKKVVKPQDGVIAGSGKKRTPGEIRIQKDIADLDGGSVATVNFPAANDLTNFTVTVTPDSGFWSKATYVFTFVIPALYPHEPPKVTCNTPIYHPNVNVQGNVCLNFLREDWKPVLDINAVIYGIIFLFYEPNPDDPLNHEAAKKLRENKNEFKKIVDKTLRGGMVEGRQFPSLR